MVEQHGKWEISSFNNVHNHNLFEGDEIYSISKMRKLTEPQEHSFFQQAKSNASNASVAKVLNREDEDGFVTTKDIANLRAKLKRELDVGSKGDSLKPFLRLLEEKNYIVKKKVNEQGNLTHLFFTQGICICSYTFFVHKKKMMLF